jgi:hypothetical protein
MPYYLIKLVSQNYKKIKAFAIEPKEHLVEITGANGAGKSAACESLLALLKWSELPKSETEPLREGTEKGFLYGEFSEEWGGKVCLEITRTFNNKGTLNLTVTDANKKKVPGGPQTVIDKFYSVVALRPNDIIEADKAELFDMLKKLVPMEVDLDALDAANDVDYNKRREINREVESLKARIPATEFPADLPPVEIDISGISKEMEAAAKANTEITERQGRREREKAKADNLRDQAKGLRQEAQRARGREVERYRGLVLAEDREEKNCNLQKKKALEQIEELKLEVAKFEGEAEDHRHMEAEYAGLVENPQNIPDPQDAIESLEMAQSRENDAVACEKRLADATPLPEPQDLSAFRQRVADATTINALVSRKRELDSLTKELKAKRSESDKLTLAMERREEQKRTAIANAKMPVPGLGFGKGEVLFNGHPLAQAGTAEKWRVAISICIAQNPGLKAILVRDGSLLDKKTKAVIRDMATEHGYTILMEEVDESGKIGFVLEDGEIVADNYKAEV